VIIATLSDEVIIIKKINFKICNNKQTVYNITAAPVSASASRTSATVIHRHNKALSLSQQQINTGVLSESIAWE